MDVVTLKKAVKDAGKYTDQEVSALEALFVDSQIVEHGSNENGGYWRWDNGLQICTKTVIINDLEITSPLGSLYYRPGGHDLGYYPAWFAQIPDRLISIMGSNSLITIAGRISIGSAASVGIVYALRPTATSNINIQIELLPSLPNHATKRYLFLLEANTRLLRLSPIHHVLSLPTFSSLYRTADSSNKRHSILVSTHHLKAKKVFCTLHFLAMRIHQS